MKFPEGYSTNYILCSLFKSHVNTIPLFLLSSDGNGNRQCLFLSVSSATQSYSTLCNPKRTAACQASLSITSSQSLLTFMFINLVMPSNHLILRHPLLLLPSVFPSIRVFPRSQSLPFLRKWQMPSLHLSPPLATCMLLIPSWYKLRKCKLILD